MKRKFILLILFPWLMLSMVFSQKLPKNVPPDIAAKCVDLKQIIKLKLDSCRTNKNIGDWKLNLLSFELLYGDGRLMFIDKEKEEALYPLQLDWKMIYDEEMIKRVIQLLKNEYRKEELDTLVNRQLAIHGQEAYSHDALWQIGLEYPKIFKHTQDSLNKYRNREIHQGLYQYDEVGRFLKWDTLPRYYFLVDSFKVAYKKETVDYYLNQIHFDIKNLLSACYYVQDKRFIQPIIHIAENLDSFGLKYNEHSIDYASEFLVKMQVEPYYSNYLKKVSHSLEEVKQIDFVNVIGFLSETLNSQDSFKELSKYLYSSAPTRAYFSEDEHGGGIKQAGKAYEDAFKEIEQNIQNKDLQAMIHASDFNLERDRFKVYDWMQKNYGKYKIKRIW